MHQASQHVGRQPGQSRREGSSPASVASSAFAAASDQQVLNQRCVNLLRFLSVDMVQKAESGHPGLPLDAAPMAYVLWTQFLKHNPRNPDWVDRDRFVLSAGHGSALLYSLLYATGYDLSLEDLKQFRQWDSKTPGHPERGHTPGVEVTTGPLGQGFANGVGMAIAEAHLAACFNRFGYELINHYTYGLLSDGDLMEGVASEAASLAGHLKLGKLIYLYDANNITLSGATDVTFTEDCNRRFEAYGWHTELVPDGNDLEAIWRAIDAAQRETERPSLITVHTHIGYGSPKQDSFEAHGSPLGVDNVAATKQHLGWPTEPLFYIPEEALSEFRHAVTRGQQAEAQWQEKFSAYQRAFPDLALIFEQQMRGILPPGWDRDLPWFEPSAKGLSTRAASGTVMNALAPRLPALMGGSADLNPSTLTALKNLGDFEPALQHKASAVSSADSSESSTGAAQICQGAVGGGWSYAGRNLAFGVREHAMGSMMNGMAAHGGIIPYGATFLTFSDYMRPPIRLAALMGLKTIYVFTHDSIALGEDGPTHQPIEHIPGLRLIPKLVVIRPADATETAAAWQMALEIPDRPVALILTRQHVPVIDRTRYAPADGLHRGAYILSESDGGDPQASGVARQPAIILIASGSEVALVMEAATVLEARGIPVRVVSMPSWKLFEAQSPAYKTQVFPPEIKARLAVEACAPQGWERYVGEYGAVIGIEHFGASAPGETVMRHFGFTVDNVVVHAMTVLDRNRGT